MKRIISFICLAFLLSCYSAVTVYGFTDGNVPIPKGSSVENMQFSLEAFSVDDDIETIDILLNDKSFLKERTHWSYSDGSASITIDKIWYGGSNVFVAHLKFSDPSRFHTVYTSGTASGVSSSYGAILTVNGDYATKTGYPSVRNGSVVNGGTLHAEATYSNCSGILSRSGWGWGAEDAASSCTVTDTFQFGPAFLSGGNITAGTGGSRAQRTFIGTNGSAGDIVIGVSSGRYADGVSAGLTYHECAEILVNYGCSFGVPLDGGGSSTMIFRGSVLVGGQRSGIGDFIVFI